MYAKECIIFANFITKFQWKYIAESKFQMIVSIEPNNVYTPHFEGHYLHWNVVMKSAKIDS